MKKLNWTNTLFLTITPLVAITGTILLALFHAIAWPTIILAIFLMGICGLGITCGYHRLFSHPTYKARPIVRFLLMIFGSGAFEGSVFEWCSDHRNHHRYTDTDQDPYDIKKGFWYAHIGWLFTLDTDKRDFDNIKDLTADPILRLQHKHYVLIATFVGFILPMLIASLWGDPLGGLIIAGALRISLVQHGTFCINSVCHIWGRRTYSQKESARDNWFTALYTFGEGFHNFHHKFPLDYRNGIRFFHFDPSKWTIWGLSKLGLASNLKRISDKRIIQCRLEADQNKLIDKYSKTSQILNEIKPTIAHAQLYIMQTLSKLENLEKSYKDLKTQALTGFNGKIANYKHQLKAYQRLQKRKRRQLKLALRAWTRLISSSKLLLKTQTA